MGPSSYYYYPSLSSFLFYYYLFHIKSFNLKSNFGQATQKKFKKAILYGKINFNNANYYGIIMMSKINAPIHSYKNPQIYYQCPKIWQKKFGNFFCNFFLRNDTRYVDLDLISVLCFLIFFNNLATIGLITKL